MSEEKRLPVHYVLLKDPDEPEVIGVFSCEDAANAALRQCHDFAPGEALEFFVEAHQERLWDVPLWEVWISEAGVIARAEWIYPGEVYRAVAFQVRRGELTHLNFVIKAASRSAAMERAHACHKEILDTFSWSRNEKDGDEIAATAREEFGATESGAIR